MLARQSLQDVPTILIATAALAGLWFLGRKLPEPLVMAVAAVIGVLIDPLTHA